VENTLYFTLVEAITPSAVQQTASGVEGWFVAELLPLLSNQYIFREVYAVSLDTETGPTATSNTSAGTVGGTPGDALPGSVALCVSFRTASRGRSFRGRNYVCGLVEPNVSGNGVAAPWAASVIGAYEGLLVLSEYVNGPWVVVSRYTNKQPRSLGIATQITDVVLVDTSVDSQRRRLPGRGR
jgi:hypothetical protein